MDEDINPPIEPTPDAPAYCGEKRILHSLQAAHRARGQAASKGRRMRIYQCEVCWYWHLTKRIDEHDVALQRELSKRGRSTGKN